MYRDEKYIDENGATHDNYGSYVATERMRRQGSGNLGFFILIVFPVYCMYIKYKCLVRDYAITFDEKSSIKDKIRFHINYTLWLFVPFIIFLSITYKYFFLMSSILMVPLIILIFYSNTNFSFFRSLKNIIIDSTTLIIFSLVIYFWMSANMNKGFENVYDQIFNAQQDTKIHAAVNQALVDNFVGIWSGKVTGDKKTINSTMSIEYSGSTLIEKSEFNSKQCRASLQLVDSSPKMLTFFETIVYGTNICTDGKVDIIFNENDKITTKWYDKDGKNVTQEGTFHKKKI